MKKIFMVSLIVAKTFVAVFADDPTPPAKSEAIVEQAAVTPAPDLTAAEKPELPTPTEVIAEPADAQKPDDFQAAVAANSEPVIGTSAVPKTEVEAGADDGFEEKEGLEDDDDYACLLEDMRCSSDNEYFNVDKRELERGDCVSLKFSDLIGYDKREDARNGENGIGIGFTVKIKSSKGNENIDFQMKFIIDEFANKSWWIRKDCHGVETLKRVTALQLNSSNLVCECCRFGKLTNFIKKIDNLTPEEMGYYLTDLKMIATEMLDNCDEYRYDHLNLSLIVIDCLSNKKEYSFGDMVALFYVVMNLRTNVWLFNESEKNNKRLVKYEGFLEPDNSEDMEFVVNL